MTENGYKLFKQIEVNQIFVKKDFKLKSAEEDFEGIFNTVGFKKRKYKSKTIIQ